MKSLNNLVKNRQATKKFNQRNRSKTNPNKMSYHYLSIIINLRNTRMKQIFKALQQLQKVQNSTIKVLIKIIAF